MIPLIKKAVLFVLTTVLLLFLFTGAFLAGADDAMAGMGTDPDAVKEQLEEQEKQEIDSRTEPAPFEMKIRFDDTYEILTKRDTAGWRGVKKDGTYVWDDALVDAYFTELKEKYDTKNGEVAFTTHNGIKMLISSNACGWHLNVEFSRQRLEETLEAGLGEMDPAWNSGLVYTKENGVGLNYVEVDIDEQKVYMYKDHELIIETDCVTGTKGYTDTTKGVFQIFSRQSPSVPRDEDKNGQKYEQPVEYWMAFNGSQGMHDATWRGQFGGNIYESWGSHGCVNLPLEAAEKIYKETYIYCPVIVH